MRRFRLVFVLSVLLAPLLAPSVGKAQDYAYIVTNTICDNQENAMTYHWATTIFGGAQHLKLFYYNSANHTFTPIGHQTALNNLTDILIGAHGAVGAIADTTAQTFSADFKANHAATPTSVLFYSCSAAAVPAPTQQIPHPLSLVGTFSRQYLQQNSNDHTAIGLLAGGESECQLTAPDANIITNYNQAVYRYNVPGTGSWGALVGYLMGQWSAQFYPGTQEDFEHYCTNNVIGGNGLQNIPAFFAEVYNAFNRDYLLLINATFGGTQLYKCGSGNDTNNRVCQ